MDTCPICNRGIAITRDTPICDKHPNQHFKPVIELIRRENMRAIKRGLPGTLTHSDYANLWNWFYLQPAPYTYLLACAYCDEEMPSGLDHWRPLASRHGTTPDNIVPCCSTCNFMKGAMSGDEFFTLLIERFKSSVAEKNYQRALAYFNSLKEDN